MKKCECQVCGERFDRITHTHLQKHNMTRQEYAEMFPSHSWQTIEPFRITPSGDDIYTKSWKKGSYKR